MDDVPSVRIGRFTIDGRRRELLRDGLPVAIGTRAFDLLCALVARRGQLATKDELMSAVWPRNVVDENNLAAQIVAVRRILAIDPELSRCVQTVPGRGYRLVADVVPQTAAKDVDHRPEAVAAAGSDTLSLVVLPFASLSSDPDQAHFAQGLSHTVATDLSRIAGLEVIAPSTAASFDKGASDARQVSRELAVQYVLTGSLQREAGLLRINAHLIDGGSGRQVWSERFDGDDRELLAFQDRITGRIANSIGREIFVAAAHGGRSRDVDPSSFDLLMRGIAADNRPQSRDVLREQEALFARAAHLDPRHAETHARLARAILLQLTQLHGGDPANESLLERGAAAAETAISLDPDNARAHCAMGLVHVARGDFERAVIANEAAIALDRNYSIAHNNLGNALVHLGRGPEALSAADAALRLDPRGPQLGAFLTTRGFAYLLMHDHDAALVSFMRAQGANALLPRAHLGAAVAHALRGDLQSARQAAAALLRIVPLYRLSSTMDGSRVNSPVAYRDFFEHVLRPGAVQAGVPD